MKRYCGCCCTVSTCSDECYSPVVPRKAPMVGLCNCTNKLSITIAIAITSRQCSRAFDLRCRSRIVCASDDVWNQILRCIHYEQAYLFGELDVAFSQFTVQELRMVVNSDAANKQLGWCRESLRNYRPNHVTTDSVQWRYCLIVRTDVPHTHRVWYVEPNLCDQILSGRCMSDPIVHDAAQDTGSGSCCCYGLSPTRKGDKLVHPKSLQVTTVERLKKGSAMVKVTA